MEEYAYFMIRVRRPPPGAPAMTGVIERLGTGEKRGFGSAEDLVRFMSREVAPRTNIGTGAAGHNASDSSAA